MQDVVRSIKLDVPAVMLTETWLPSQRVDRSVRESRKGQNRHGGRSQLELVFFGIYRGYPET
jgi:hypothetical protein